jgi:hypothetical protein
MASISCPNAFGIRLPVLKKQNPGPHSARGMNPSSYITTIGMSDSEVKIN